MVTILLFITWSEQKFSYLFIAFESLDFDWIDGFFSFFILKAAVKLNLA